VRVPMIQSTPPPRWVAPTLGYSSPSLPSYSGYGSISTSTGLPRTNWVNPYFRSSGTYVPGYYRSCSYCR
jgi:hypothetical protein